MAGTEQFGNYFIPALPTDPLNFLADGNYLYFGGKQPGTGPGTELWRTDGTVAGTTLVKDINPGAAASNPREFAFANGLLYFQATVEGHGSELAVSDGTEAGTHLFNDIAPGTANAAPRHIAPAGNHLIFIADDPAHGTKLFTLDLTTGTFAPLQSNIALNIAPNPATDHTQLTLPADCDWQHSRVRLFRTTGQLVLETVLLGNTYTIPLQTLSGGLYRLEYRDTSGHFGWASLIKK